MNPSVTLVATDEPVRRAPPLLSGQRQGMVRWHLTPARLEQRCRRGAWLMNSRGIDPCDRDYARTHHAVMQITVHGVRESREGA